MTTHVLPQHVPGIAVGDIVFSRYGRPMRVERTDEFVRCNDQTSGPYCALQALDDKNCSVIWPRSWYTTRGEQFVLFSRSVTP